ncbi:MAG: LCP family protein [Ruminococcus sp.]|nr:LCP family protein [Ruminococcus sp.]
MSENNNPINRENRAQDEQFKNMLKEVFGQKEKIVNNRFKDSDSNSTVGSVSKPASERPQTKRPVQRNNARPESRNTSKNTNTSGNSRPTENRRSLPNGNQPRRPAASNTNARPQRSNGQIPLGKRAASPSDIKFPQSGNKKTRPPVNAEKKSDIQNSGKQRTAKKKNTSGKLLRGKDGKPLTGKQKTIRILVIIVAVVLILCLIGYCVFHFYYSLFGRYHGERNNGEYIYNDSDYTGDPDTMTPEEAEAALKKQLEGQAAELMKDKDVMNILLIGEDLRDTEDEERGNTDVMMMISLNKKNKTITMTSFMRDAWVYIDGYGQAKLNAAYWVDGPELLKSTLQDYYGVSIDRYVIVNFNSFIDIIDALDGIDMEVTDEEAEGMKAPMAEQNNILGNKKGTDYLSKGGKLRLNGNQALAFARLRYVGNADYERTERQRRVIAEIIKEAKNLSLVEINSLVKKIFPDVKLDIKESEMAALLLNCFDYMNYDIQELRIPADDMFSEQIINGLSVLCPDFTANTRKIIETVYGKEALDEYDKQNPQAVETYNDYNAYGGDNYYGYNYNYGY